MPVELITYIAGIIAITTTYGAWVAFDDETLCYAGIFLIGVWIWPIILPIILLGGTGYVVAESIRACTDTVEASASHTNALAERDARVRAEVLDAAHKYLCDQYGNSPLGHPIDRKRILSLIPVNQEENLND